MHYSCLIWLQEQNPVGMHMETMLETAVAFRGITHSPSDISYYYFHLPSTDFALLKGLQVSFFRMNPFLVFQLIFLGISEHFLLSLVSDKYTLSLNHLLRNVMVLDLKRESIVVTETVTRGKRQPVERETNLGQLYIGCRLDYLKYIKNCKIQATKPKSCNQWVGMVSQIWDSGAHFPVVKKQINGMLVVHVLSYLSSC